MKTTGERGAAHKLRRELKRNAIRNLKRNYWICLFSFFLFIFLGAFNSEAMKLFSESKNPLAKSENSSEETVVSVATVNEFIGTSGRHTLELFDRFYNRLTGDSHPKIQSGTNMLKETISTSNPLKGELPFYIDTRGVLRNSIANMTFSSYFVGVGMRVYYVFRDSPIAVAIQGMVVILASVFFWIMLTNILEAVNARIYLEGRIYSVIPVRRFLFFRRVLCLKKVAWTCLVRAVYQSLWELTVVGFFVKRYSYAMVPYIVAENPALSANEAITLSRRMMDGHKWECFKIDLSFLGWRLVTLHPVAALIEVFFSGPYYYALRAEYYAVVREDAKNRKVEGVEKLNDEYLFRIPDESVVRAIYPEDSYLLDTPTVTIPKLTGIEGFFSEWFGIVFRENETVKNIRKTAAMWGNQKELRDMAAGREYAGVLHPLSTRVRERLSSYRYLQSYPLWNIILFFFAVSMAGWFWEVGIYLLEDGIFINRGSLHGPWLPIWGGGGMLVIILLKKFRKHPVLHLFLSVAVCGTVEFLSSWAMERATGKRWWDYSGYYLNIDGRVCAEGLLIFGIATTAATYLLMPMLNDRLNRLSTKILIPLALTLTILFAIDGFYSKAHPNVGKGITDKGRNTEETGEVPETETMTAGLPITVSE